MDLILRTGQRGCREDGVLRSLLPQQHLPGRIHGSEMGTQGSWGQWSEGIWVPPGLLLLTWGV